MLFDLYERYNPTINKYAAYTVAIINVSLYHLFYSNTESNLLLLRW